MKRSGFTMIELIFVIVILGILAAVALPKFIGVSEQAQQGKATAYVGTLNRTVGPALWAESVGSGNGGSVAAVTQNDVRAQIETPDDIGDANTPNLTTCTYTALSSPATDAELLALPSVSSFTIGAASYNIRCNDGTATQAPRFVLTKNGTDILAK